MFLLILALGCSGTDSGDDTAGDGTGTDITGDPAIGETLFAACAGCHGADGTGGIDIGGTPSADLTVKVPSLTDDELADRIMNGFGTAMPAQYTDSQDVADVIAHLRLTFP